MLLGYDIGISYFSPRRQVMYIERQLEKKFIAINEDYACVLLTGPHQVGKSTMLRHLMEGTTRTEVSPDDFEERRLAKTDPAMFFEAASCACSYR